MSINGKQVKGKSLNMFLIPHFFLLYFLLLLSGTLNVGLAKRGEENYYYYEVKTHFGYWLCQCSSWYHFVSKTRVDEIVHWL